MVKNKRILIVLTFLLLIFFSNSASASTIFLESEIGFQGKCKLDCLASLEVNMASSDQEIKGILKIITDNQLLEHEVLLPPQTSKIFEFSLPIQKGRENIKVSLQSKGEVLAENILTPEVLPTKTFMIGILSDNKSNYDFLNNLTLEPWGINTYVVNLADLKDLGSLNLIILDDFNLAKLGEEKQQLIKNWLSRGNSLLANNKNEIISWGAGLIIPVNGSIEPSNIENIKKAIHKSLTPYNFNKLFNTVDATNLDNFYTISDDLLKTNNKTVFLLLSLVVLYCFCLVLTIIFRKKYPGLFAGAVLSFCLLFTGIALWGGIEKGKGACVGVNFFNKALYTEKVLNFYPQKNKKNILTFAENTFFKELNGTNYVQDPIKKTMQYNDNSLHSIYYQSLANSLGQNIELAINSQEIVTGEITNPLSTKLEKSFLIIGDTLIPLGDIRGKEKINIRYKLEHNLQDLGDFNYVQKISNTCNFTEKEKKLWQNFYYDLENDLNRCFLVGLSIGEEKLLVNGKSQTFKEKSLNVFSVNLKCSDIPRGLIRPVFASTGEELKKGVNECILKEGEAVKIFYPLLPNLTPQKIDLHFHEETKDLNWQIYNYSIEDWDELHTNQLEKNVFNKYIDDGSLILRVEGNKRIILPQIFLQGLSRNDGEIE